MRTSRLAAAYAALGMGLLAGGCGGFGGGGKKSAGAAVAPATSGTVATSSSSGTAGVTSGSNRGATLLTYVDDVKPVLAAKNCAQCHNTLVPQFVLSKGL